MSTLFYHSPICLFWHSPLKGQQGDECYSHPKVSIFAGLIQPCWIKEKSGGPDWTDGDFVSTGSQNSLL